MLLLNNTGNTVTVAGITFAPSSQRELGNLVLSRDAQQQLAKALAAGLLAAMDADAKRLINLQNVPNAVYHMPDNQTTADGLMPAMLSVDPTTGNLNGIVGPGNNVINIAGAPRTITASDTVLKTDVSGLITYNSASPGTLTIPNDATGGWSANEFISAYQAGAGAISFVAGSGVTLRAASGIPASVQYGTIGVHRVGPNEWALV